MNTWNSLDTLDTLDTLDNLTLWTLLNDNDMMTVLKCFKSCSIKSHLLIILILFSLTLAKIEKNITFKHLHDMTLILNNFVHNGQNVQYNKMLAQNLSFLVPFQVSVSERGRSLLGSYILVIYV